MDETLQRHTRVLLVDSVARETGSLFDTRGPQVRKVTPSAKKHVSGYFSARQQALALVAVRCRFRWCPPQTHVPRVSGPILEHRIRLPATFLCPRSQPHGSMLLTMLLLFIRPLFTLSVFNQQTLKNKNLCVEHSARR